VLKSGSTTLAIVEVPDDNSSLETEVTTKSHPLPLQKKRGKVNEVRHRLANQLQLMAEKGRIAQRMLHQK